MRAIDYVTNTELLMRVRLVLVEVYNTGNRVSSSHSFVLLLAVRDNVSLVSVLKGSTCVVQNV